MTAMFDVITNEKLGQDENISRLGWPSADYMVMSEHRHDN